MDVASYGTDDCSRRAGSVLAMMDKFPFIMGLKLSFFLFGITEQLSITLQGKSITVDDPPQHVFTSVEEYFRKGYYEVLSNVLKLT